MIYTCKVLVFFTFVIICEGENIEIFDFFGTGVKDHENIRFGSLKTASDQPLGQEFTVCGSLLLRAFTDEQSIFQTFDKHNNPWFASYVR